MRDWKQVEEGLILDVYKASQVKIDALLNDCKNLFFPSNITQLEGRSESFVSSHQSNSVNVDEMNELTFDDLAENPDLAKQGDEPETPFRRQRSSIAISSIRIITEEELTRVKAKLF